MTTTEFSNEFDVLYNNAMSNQAPGLDEYEKSVFLTKAQDQLVKDYFNNRVDGVGGGFDGSQKRQYDFSGLIRVENLYNINAFKERIDETEKLDKRSLVYLFPPNYFLSVNELLSDSHYQYSVIPLQYTDYQRMMMKPYNFPVKRAAWRLFTDKKNCNYWEQKETRTEEDGTVIEEAMYSFLTTWADKKRNISLHLQVVGNDDTYPIPLESETQHYRKETVTFNGEDYDALTYQTVTGEPDGEPTVMNDFYPITVAVSTKWVQDVYTIKIIIFLASFLVDDLTRYYDDQDVVLFLQQFVKYLEKHPNYLKSGATSLYEIDNDIVKAFSHTDRFVNFSAPSKRWSFFADNGKEISTKVVELPMAEIIGKFKDAPNYQLRYVRTLTPIILENLDNYGDDLAIRGVSTITQCILPEECHQEILERAVTLAKIAYAGSTESISKAQQRKSND